MKVITTESGSTQPQAGDSPARRAFLGSIAALGASALFPGCASVETGTAARRIDVHHHIAPPAYTAALKERMRGHAPWSVQRSLEDMDKSGIATSVTSLINPDTWLGDVAFARRLARIANEYAATLARDYPGRFGFFASLTLPDVEGSLREIEYAMDALKADGIYLIVSYDGKYLGHPDFTPVLEELNRRKAVVYTHPLAPQCCAQLQTSVSTATIEFAVDTTRTMASLMFTGSAARFPDIRWIFSHSGGVTPFLLSRFTREADTIKDSAQKMPKGAMHELGKFYYETAQGNHAGALWALLKIAPISHVLYGTDFPFRDGAEVNAGLAAYGFSAADMRAINRENALRLLPRLQA
jgi:predicted TIM-barrel fold metal-dependent hydrolase